MTIGPRRTLWVKLFGLHVIWVNLGPHLSPFKTILCISFCNILFRKKIIIIWLFFFIIFYKSCLFVLTDSLALEKTAILQFSQGTTLFLFLTIFVIFLTFFSIRNIVDSIEQAKLCSQILVWRQTVLKWSIYPRK